MECVICGGGSFGAGPGGRMAVTKTPPRCETCQSLERHRAIRGFFDRIYDKALFSNLNVLQFSQDSAVKHDWFGKYEYSVYEGHNSLDLQNVDRESGTYDLVICNHVLEHVPSDGDALRELTRIIKRDGVVFLTVPDPARRPQTVEWGFPDMSRHGHYREYGSDIVHRFDQHIPSVFVCKVEIEDTVTRTPDIAYLLAHQHNALLKQVRKSGYRLTID